MQSVNSLFQEARLPDRERERIRSYLDLLGDEGQDIVARWVGALPERQRLALALFCFESLRPSEIACVLGAKEAAVQQLLQQAAESLRARIERERARAAQQPERSRRRR